MRRMTDESKGVPLHTKILIALVLGAAIGVTVNLLAAPPPIRSQTLLLFGVHSPAGGPASTLATLHLALAKPDPTWLDLLITYVMRPVGEIFLRLLFLTVIPLVFS